VGLIIAKLDVSEGNGDKEWNGGGRRRDEKDVPGGEGIGEWKKLCVKED